jgi:hypothetical protein
VSVIASSTFSRLPAMPRGLAPWESIENAAAQRDDSRAQPEAARGAVAIHVSVLLEGGRQPRSARLVHAQRIGELRDDPANARR